MKVLHLLGFKEDRGGVFSVLRNLQEASKGTHWSHSVWVSEGFEETRTPNLDYRYSKYAGSESSPFNTLMALPAIRKLLKHEHFDLIHSHSRHTLPLAIFVAKVMKRSVIFTNHNYARRRGLYRWASTVDRMHTVVLTPSMGRYYSIPIRPPVTSIIPAFCADRFFDEPLAGRNGCFSSENPLRLTGVGMLTAWKGWHTLAEAVDLLSPEERAAMEFTHWGEDADPEYTANLKEYVSSHGLTDVIRFMGPTNQIIKALYETDWLVHPAVMDPFPVSVIEALALGLPALVTNSGGPVDMVRPGSTGLIFEPGNAQELSENLRRILRGEMQPVSPAEVRDSVRDISASAVAGKYFDLYEQVLATSRN